MRRLLTIFLLLLLPLTSLSVQGAWLSSEKSLAHEMEHLERISHHHAADGSIHYDESSESLNHFYEHAGVQQTVALPSTTLPPLAITSITVSANTEWLYIPTPIPEQLQRPPSLTPG